MTNQPTEIAIVGGGMVGGALALGLGAARVYGDGNRTCRACAVCGGQPA
ncbi:2-octaprenyl-3-methyl-6-methoxy-1,4-benzoquinol hydroxylase [Salmonella enterica subsp. enterica]|uniref:2-octaprenyl-3-methyl-6-methoxy-1,4-benzoquinol hydroxylase n=1 Tax=Salmonella enterica I TaxID=59201 RepID=A0A447U7Q0_SALET|nr:2-octaprenyl-3-methyl-6-methoxy-1,4-benzoquinol hydroxylase [Salmonella enterica subsp. enterica]